MVLAEVSSAAVVKDAHPLNGIDAEAAHIIALVAPSVQVPVIPVVH